MRHLTLFCLSALLALASHGATISVTNTAGGSTLYLAGVGTNDNGMTVQCVATNAYGSATGAVATLTVVNPPIFSETFEGANSGYDNAGWTESGSPNPNYTNIVLQGSQSLYIANNSSDASPSFAPQDTLYAYFRLMFTNQLVGGNYILLRSGTTATAAKLGIWTTKFDVFQGTSDSPTSASITTNTMYYVCVRYTKSSGANNGIASVEFSTDGTQLGSGTKFVQVSNGDSTNQVDNIRFMGDADMGVVVDQVKVFTSSQGAMQ